MSTQESRKKEINKIIRTQLTLAGSKLAADTMHMLVSSLGLSVLAIVWCGGKTLKRNIFNLIPRDWTTISHTISHLVQSGYLQEQTITHKEKYLTLTPRGTDLYVQFIKQAALHTQALESLMPENHIAHPAE